MASSSGKRNYPSRLYEEGKSPLQNKSINHNCFRAKFAIIKDGLGDDVWSDWRDSSVGVFIKFAEMKYVWAAGRVPYFLTHQLAIQNSHEIWSLFGGRPIRFSLNEFADITGLKCDLFPQNDELDIDHTDLWEELGLSTSDSPTYTELVELMSTCATWSKPKRLMVGRLVVLSVGVYGISHGSRIPLLSAKRVLDSVAFENYPWGRVAFDSLIRSIKVVEYHNDSYSIHGCVQVLLTWIYESVPGLGETYGKKKETADVPLLSWESSRTRFNFQKFIDEEKAAHGEVRVRHMIPVFEKNMYPIWSDDSHQPAEPALENLIRDITNGCLPMNVWDGVKTATNGKKKRKEPSTKKEAGSRSSKKVKKKVLEEEDAEDFKEDQVTMAGILKIMEKMSDTMETLGKDLNSRMDALDERLKSHEILEKDLKAMQVQTAAVELRLNSVEKGFKDQEVRLEAVQPKVDDEAESNNPVIETSQDGLPSQRVVKNKKKKVAAAVNHVIVTKIKQEKTDKDPEETWSDRAENMADAAIGNVLTALHDKITNLDAGTSKPKRIPQLSVSEISICRELYS